MNFYYVYILKSGKDNNFYIGYTENLKSRFEQHKKGKVESTKDRRPLEIIYSEACLDIHDAMHRKNILRHITI